MPKNDFCFLYVPVGSEGEAGQIARDLIDAELIACANILPGMKSIYRWQGKIEEQREVLLVLKTRRALAGEVTTKIEDLHSYDTPCVATIALADLNAAYAQWLLGETRAD
ncbi:MAG: divalent-cation tolerance protein CutA [Bdellovibrionales bacterium]|nr:divalent-cation tolerance protein CutA [Bdellovibrionales bacterium]